MCFFSSSDDSQVTDIDVLNIEDRGSTIIVNYASTYSDGTIETSRTNVKYLGGYNHTYTTRTVARAECIGKVYCGVLKTDVRIIFFLKFFNGTARLVQEQEGRSGCMELFRLCSETEKRSLAEAFAQLTTSSDVEPHPLQKNELPQGEYIVGKDIPAGDYDFFVVFGDGGRFSKARYDSDGKIIDGTLDAYWIGLKEDYEIRKLIHISCKEGEKIQISGNVILKIAKSKPVQIEL